MSVVNKSLSTFSFLLFLSLSTMRGAAVVAYPAGCRTYGAAVERSVREEERKGIEISGSSPFL
jgi:hypothetical protein